MGDCLMCRKSTIVTLAGVFGIVLLVAGGAFAQNSDDAKAKYEQLIAQISELDKKMANVKDQAEYDKLNQQRQALVEEANHYKDILMGDAETKRKINEVKKIFKNGNTAYKLRRYSDALAEYDKAIANGEALNNPLLNETIAQIYTNKAMIYQAQKNWLKMSEAAQGAIDMKPDYAKAYSLLGSAFVRLSKTDEAVAAYLKAVEIDKNYYTVYLNLGNIYFRQKNYDKAIEAFTGAFQANPEYDKAFYMLGRSYFEKKEFRSAETALQKAISINEADHLYYWFLAQSLNKMSRYEEARTVADKGTKYNVTYGGLYLELGRAYKGLGQKVRALENFEKAMKDKQFKAQAEYEIKYYDKGN